MAGESKPLKSKAPKLFSENAKLASAKAQANLDMLDAQIQGQLAMQKAQLKAKTSQLQFGAQQADAGIQARMDAAAANAERANEEPVGPVQPTTPYPNASQPSQGMGQGGVDLNALLQPGAIQGGAGIQQATGGMGRAQPPGVNPQQLQAQVNPYNVSQSTTERTVPMQSPGGGYIRNVPQISRETRVKPNQLTPFEVGRLQQEDAVLRARQANFADMSEVRWEKLNLEQQKTVSKLATDASERQRRAVLNDATRLDMSDKQRDRLQKDLAFYGNPLADLYAIGTEGRISKTEFEARKDNILGSIKDPEARNAVETYAQRQFSTVQAARSLKGTGLAVQIGADGKTTIAQGDAKSILENIGMDEANTQRTLAFRKLQSGASGLQQMDEFLNLVAPGGTPDPSLLGAGGSATKLTTRTIGALSSFVPKLADKLVSDLTKDLQKQQADPNISQQEKDNLTQLYLGMKNDIMKNFNPYQPEVVGAMAVMVNAMRATLARGELGGELNIRGYEALGPSFLDPTGYKGSKQAYQELLRLRERFVQNSNLGRADYERTGGTRGLTQRQILGLDPMPEMKIEEPEVSAADIYGNMPAGLKVPPKPKVVEPGTASGKVWKREELH